LVGPDVPDDFHPRVAAGGVDPDQAATGRQGPGQRGEHVAHLGLERGGSPVGLGGDDEVVGTGVGDRVRDQRTQHELVVATVEDDDGRPTYTGLPVRGLVSTSQSSARDSSRSWIWVANSWAVL